MTQKDFPHNLSYKSSCYTDENQTNLLQIGFEVSGLVIQVFDVLQALSGGFVQTREDDGFLANIENFCWVVHLPSQGFETLLDRFCLVRHFLHEVDCVHLTESERIIQ